MNGQREDIIHPYSLYDIHKFNNNFLDLLRLPLISENEWG